MRLTRFWWGLALGVCLVFGGGPRSLRAQSVTQVKPWFLLIVDTSSSMDECTASPCGASDPLNTCGFRRNRLGDAKCAIQRIVASTGDAELALMQYAHPCSATCDDTSDGVCDAQLLVPLSDSNQPTLYQWVDGVCQSNCTGTNYTREIRMGNNTPIAASLERAHQYLAGTLPRAQVVGIANSGTPYPSPIANDPFLDCRPVSVIMLTDGAESCGGDPDMEAAQLFAAGTAPMGKRVRTYVIGFGVDEGDADIESLAMAGGTDAPGPQRGFYATNEQGLSLALNQIIADSQLPPETCNGVDDNCNDLIDEGIQKYCDPTNIAAGPTLCDEPDELLCDGIDDDCDGIIDEGVSNACGVCGALPTETCDNTDNDCDGRIDEGVVTGEPCGTMAGSCQTGTTACANGELICVGQLTPGVEICDCLDNDCDGFIDEFFDGDPLCATGASCVACGCQTLCTVTEFSEVFCPSDRMPEVLDTGLCICVDSTCDANACAMETQERGGEVVCAPDSEDVTRCVCKAGSCVDACADVSCPDGQVCDPRDTRGRCKPDNCLALGCRSDEVCNAVSGACEPDLCVGMRCRDDQACRDGVCEMTCTAVRCDSGERCQRGECIVDRCARVACDLGQVCDPSDGACVAINACDPVCIGDATCNTLTGMCVENPCRRLHCPDNSVCRAGECVSTGLLSDAGGPPEQVLATGGGGCACTIGSASRNEGNRGWLLALSLLAAWAWRLRRRARRTHASIISAVLLVTTLLGCDVDPFCVANCETRGKPADSGAGTGGTSGTAGSDDDGGAGNGGTSGSGGANNDGGIAGDDGGMSNCRRGTPETCNGRDDDCDFKVDEDAFQPVNFCDSRGVCADDQLRCNGMAGWICRHSDDHEPVEMRCDGLDNDCDGAIDEGTINLGNECGVGIGACRVTGELVCNDSGVGTQCSLNQPGAPDVEICDGIDNDCDGLIDEPKSAPGDNPSYVQDPLVQIGSFWIYPYEASRPDATASSQGNINARACTKAGVLPWTNVTYAQARAACMAAGMNLCTEAQWRSACEDGPGSSTCAWSFTTAGNACGNLANTPNQCNGEEYDADSMTAGDSDALLPTGSMPRCFASTAGGAVFDLSGNAKEFTLARSGGANPVRGGSYNNVAAGLRCDFDFTVVNNTFKFQNVGFRCCATTNPN